MEIHTKYNIGDAVWRTVAVSFEEPRTVCPACGGTHIVKINGYEFVCLNCTDGYADSKRYKTKYVPQRAFVHKVFAETSDPTSKDIIERYEVVDDSSQQWKNLYKKDGIYDSEEECQKACDKFNKAD